jgi:ABC-type transport system involved in cytochrome bd biosynthesis fused ATPase/permease subunit
MICKYVWIGGFLVADISIFTTNTYRVLAYMYENKDKNNIVNITQNEIAQALDLNKSSVNMMMKTLKEKAKDKTVLLVTHNPTEIALADRVIVIKNGQIESDGTPFDLIETSPFLKSSLTKQDILSKQKLFSKIA